MQEGSWCCSQQHVSLLPLFIYDCLFIDVIISSAESLYVPLRTARSCPLCLLWEVGGFNDLVEMITVGNCKRQHFLKANSDIFRLYAFCRKSFLIQLLHVLYINCINSCNITTRWT